MAASSMTQAVPGPIFGGGGGGTTTLTPPPSSGSNPFMSPFPTGQSVPFYDTPGQLPGLGSLNPFGFGSNNPSYTTNINPYTGAGRALVQDLSKAGLGASASGILSGLVSSGALFDPTVLNNLQSIMQGAPGTFGNFMNFAGGQTSGFEGFNNNAFGNFMGEAANNFGLLQNQAAGESSSTSGNINNIFNQLLGQASGESSSTSGNVNSIFGNLINQASGIFGGLNQQVGGEAGGFMGANNAAFGGLSNELQNFMAQGSGYNPQVAQALFAQMQPQINQQMQSIAESYGGMGMANSSSGAEGLANYLGQVNANQQATNANLYQQSIQNFLSAQGQAGTNTANQMGLNESAFNTLAGVQLGAAQGQSAADTAAAQGNAASQVNILGDLLGAQTAAAQGNASGQLGVLGDLLSTQTAAAQGLTGAQLAGTQGMTSNDLSAMQTLLGTDSSALQNMFGTEIGASTAFGNTYNQGISNELGILGATSRQKSNPLSDISSLLGGLGGGSGISSLLGVFGL